MSKVYVAQFHGDIDFPPVVGNTLNQCLNEISKLYGYGNKQINKCDPRCDPEEEGCKSCDYEYYITPDPEDDKIEIWEIDSDAGTAKVVSGFFGWHWQKPEGATDMVMPGHTKTLYELAMEDY